MPELVTDPELLKQLNAPSGQEVTDPAILAQLEGKPPPVQAQPLSAGDVLSGAITNLPESALSAGENIYTAIRHPLDTANALGDVAAGGLEKLTGAQIQPEAQKFDALVGMLKDRYGGMEATKKTIATDPVGFLMDLSTVLGGTGAGLKAAGEAGKIGALAKVGEVTGAVGAAVDPLSLAGSAIKVPLGMTKLPEVFYQSAVKPSTTLTPEMRAARVETGLAHGILPTENGLNKLSDKIDSLNQQISDKILPAAQRGDTINSADIVRRVDDLKKFYQNTTDPQPYLDELDKLKKAFQDFHGQQIPVDVAQEIKKNTYRILKDEYGSLSSVTVEARKSLARGIKEELAKKYPELSKLNAEDSALIELNKSIEKAVGRIGNQNIVGLGTPLVGAAAGAVTKSPELGVLAAISKAILDDPTYKSAIGIALHRARKAAFTTQLSKTQKIGQAAFQGGRIKNNAATP